MKVNQPPDRAKLSKALFARGSFFVTIIGMLLLLLLYSSSLFGRGVLNLGYVQLTGFLIDNGLSFSRVEPLCPQDLRFPSYHVSLDSKRALMTMGFSLRYHQSASPYLGMGMIYLALGDPKQAQQVFQIALSVDENDLRARRLLGCAYLQSGESDSAIMQWRNIPNFGMWRIVRGNAFRLDGNWEASNRDYYAVVQLNPSSYLYHMIACNHVKLGQISEALAAYRKAIELGQPYGDNYVPEMSRLELAKLYISNGDWYNARTELEIVISAHPASAEAYEQLGVVFYNGFNDLQSANSLLIRSIELDPNAAKSYLYLGSFNRAQGEYVVAQKWLNAGLALPNNMWTPWLHGELGRVYLEQGRYMEAIPELAIVVDVVPTDTWYLELLGDAYRHVGQLNEASQYYQQILTLSPGNKQIEDKITALGELHP